MVLQSQMKLQVLVKKYFRKKNSFTLFVQIYDLQNGVRNFFKNKWVSRYLSFGDFKVPKNSSSQ